MTIKDKAEPVKPITASRAARNVRAQHHRNAHRHSSHH